MERQVRLTIGPAALAVVFGSIIVALVARNVLEAGRRPLGWALAAAVAAAALEPLVARASRYMRRGVALVVVLVPILAVVGLVVWGVVGDLDAEVRHLQQDIPRVAADIEDSERFGEAAREFRLAERAQELADGLRRPSSRVGEEALGGASTWFLTLILTVFGLIWGPRFSAAALRQLPDDRSRARVSDVVGRAFARSQAHVETSVVLAALTGLVFWGVFTLIDLPTPTPLALAVGVGSLIPGIGVVLSVLPAALLAGGLLSPGTGVAVAVAGVVAQVVHHLVLRRLTRGAAHPGAAVLVISFFVGYEVYGVGGAVVGTCLAVFATALLDSLAEAEAEAAAPPGAGATEDPTLLAPPKTTVDPA